MNQNLLTKLEEVLKIKKEEAPSIKITEEQRANQTIQKADNTLDAQNSCVTKVDLTAYQQYTVLGGVPKNVSPETFKTALETVLPGQSNQLLRTYIYCISYVTSFVKSSNSGAGNFVGYNNNLGLLSLDINFQPRANKYFKKEFCCVNVKSVGKTQSMPIVSFATLEDYIKFMGDSLANRAPQIEKIGLDKYYACYWPKDNVSESYFDTNRGEFETLIKTMEDAIKSAVAVKLVTESTADALDETNNRQSGSTPGVTPTPTPLYPNPGQVCPPPYVNSFAPAVGYTGTQMVINGRNLDTATKVFFKEGNTEYQVEERYVTIINPQTLRIVVPVMGQGTTVKNTTVKVQTSYGSFTTVAQFKYDPAAPVGSSPGSVVNGASGVGSTSNVNTNPTTPALKETQRTTATNGTTDLLKVEVAQNVGVWSIKPTQTLTYTSYKIEAGPNNTIVRSQLAQGTQSLNNFLSNNNQTFSINKTQVDVIFKGLIPEQFRSNSEVDYQIQITGIPADRTANPQDQMLSFNGKMVYGTSATQGPTPQIPNPNPPHPANLILVTETNENFYPIQNAFQGGGRNNYAIKKSTGGYYVYRFELSKEFTISRKDEPELYKVPEMDKQSIRVVTSPDTGYQNEIIFNGKGEYQLSVTYKVNERPDSTYTATSGKLFL